MQPLRAGSTVLVLAPHTDDGEFGAGGSIARWVEEGHRIVYAAFSSCEASLPKDMPADTLIRELKEAAKVLGVCEDNLIIHNFPVRRFQEHRQEILETMLDIRVKFSPSIVLMPSVRDVHQDHGTVAQEAMRAFKRDTLVAYEVPWNNFQFTSNLFVKLEQRHVDLKVAAISKYISQRDRAYAQEDYVVAQTRYRGTQVHEQFAETFEVLRWLM